MNLKKPLFILLVTVTCLVLSIVVLTFAYKDKVTGIVVDAINDRLEAKVEVKNISFSLFSNFPFATVEFSGVIVSEPPSFVTTGEVLNADKVSLMFGFASIFRNSYHLKKVVVENASLNLQTDTFGNHNYSIWKKDRNNDAGEQIALELEKVVFEKVDVFYYHAGKLYDIHFFVDNGEFSGDFNSEKYTMSSEAILQNTTVEIDEINYLSDAGCKVLLSLEIDNTSSTYTFRNSGVTIKGLSLNLDGTIKTGDQLDHYDLIITSPSADLPALMSLIPGKYHGRSDDFNYSGNVEFKGSVKGKSGKSITPLVTFGFTCSNVKLNPKNTPYHLKNMNGRGFFTNKKSNTVPVTYLRLENFNATLDGKPLRADIEIENFKKPRIKVSASLQAELSAISRFYKPDTLETINGLLFADFSFNGIADQKSTYNSSGDIRFEKVSFTIRQKPVDFKNFSGRIILNGNDVTVENLGGNAGSSDFNFTGNFNNLVAFILLKEQRLDIHAGLKSKYIDLDELLSGNPDDAKSANAAFEIRFSDKLRFNIQAAIGTLKFRKFHAEDIAGIIAMESKVLMTRELDFKTSEGQVRIKGSIDNRSADSLKISYDALVNSLNIRQLFKEMGNFGQAVIVERHLKGTVSAEVQFRSMWTNRLELNERSVYAKSDITIDNGELIDFEPMLALSKFLKGSDLKVIRFSTLSNTIEIRDRKIFIPRMEIKSNALDLTASGEHTFDNNVDYRLQLYLSQILGKKVRQQNTEFGTIEDDGLGRPRIFLRMTGLASDPKFTWDRSGVEKKITEEIKNETRNLRSLLKEEFGRKDEVKEAPKEVKKQEELQIEFDDEE